MRKLIFTLILLLAGYIGFMYFFGKGEDKSDARTVVRETKDLGKAVGDFLKDQKEKYDQGDFDKLIDKIGKSVEKLKSGSSKNSDDVKKDLRDLQMQLKQIDVQKLSEEDRKSLQKLIDDIEQQLNQ